MRKIKILSICIIAIMLLVAICPIVSNADTTTVEFEDSELAQKFATKYNCSIEGKKVTVDDITKFTSVQFVGLEGLSTCTSLVGLEKFTNLTYLNISGGKFTDLTPIGNLTKLNHLIINSSKANSIDPILELENLQTLDLSNNNLTSIKGIEKLKNLEHLNIGNGNGTTDESVMDKNQINKISDISGIEKLTKLKSFIATNMIINQKVSVDSSKKEVTVDLPGLVIAAKTQGSMVYTSKPLEVENGTLSSDSKKITMSVEDLKAGKVKVTIVGSDDSAKTAAGTVVKFEYVEAEGFKVVSVTKTPDTATDGKVKVTITVNKELDPDKIPEGWTLGDDKKSISKEFDKNGKEDVVLTDKDGNTIKQTVEVSNIKDKDGEEFKVINKTEEDQGNGKIKITITVNKELDPNNLPSGWTLGEDGKSIWKVMNKGVIEELTLVAKDGSKINYTVGTIIQAGVNNTILIVIAAIAIVGTVVFVKSRKVLK